MMRVVYFLGGVCWLAIAGGFGLFLWKYLTEGAGLQFFGIFSSTSVLLGLVHVVGLTLATVLSLAYAVYFFAKSTVSHRPLPPVGK